MNTNSADLKDLISLEFDQYIQGMDRTGFHFRKWSPGVSGDEKEVLGALLPNILPWKQMDRAGEPWDIHEALIVLPFKNNRIAITMVFDDYDQSGRRLPMTHTLILGRKDYESFGANPFALVRQGLFSMTKDQNVPLGTLSVRIPKDDWTDAAHPGAKLFALLAIAVFGIENQSPACIITDASPRDFKMLEWLYAALPVAERSMLALSTVKFEESAEELRCPFLKSPFWQRPEAKRLLMLSREVPQKYGSLGAVDIYESPDAALNKKGLPRQQHPWIQIIEKEKFGSALALTTRVTALEAGRDALSLIDMALSMQVRINIERMPAEEFIAYCKDYFLRHTNKADKRYIAECGVFYTKCKSLLLEGNKKINVESLLVILFRTIEVTEVDVQELLCEIADRKDTLLLTSLNLFAGLEAKRTGREKTRGGAIQSLVRQFGMPRLNRLLEKGPKSCTPPEKEEIVKWMKRFSDHIQWHEEFLRLIEGWCSSPQFRRLIVPALWDVYCIAIKQGNDAIVLTILKMLYGYERRFLSETVDFYKSFPPEVRVRKVAGVIQRFEGSDAAFLKVVLPSFLRILEQIRLENALDILSCPDIEKSAYRSELAQHILPVTNPEVVNKKLDRWVRESENREQEDAREAIKFAYLQRTFRSHRRIDPYPLAHASFYDDDYKGQRWRRPRRHRVASWSVLIILGLLICGFIALSLLLSVQVYRRYVKPAADRPVHIEETSSLTGTTTGERTSEESRQPVLTKIAGKGAFKVTGVGAKYLEENRRGIQVTARLADTEILEDGEAYTVCAYFYYGATDEVPIKVISKEDESRYSKGAYVEKRIVYWRDTPREQVFFLDLDKVEPQPHMREASVMVIVWNPEKTKRLLETPPYPFELPVFTEPTQMPGSFSRNY